MRDSVDHIFSDSVNYRIVIITLDSHNARPCERALLNMLPILMDYILIYLLPQNGMKTQELSWLFAKLSLRLT